MKAGEILTKHRNLFLVLLLAATLAISGAANQERLQANAPTVEIPVMAVSGVMLMIVGLILCVNRKRNNYEK